MHSASLWQFAPRSRIFGTTRLPALDNLMTQSRPDQRTNPAILGGSHARGYACLNGTTRMKEREPMKDIPGIDENGNPKNGPFQTFFKNGLVSCEGAFTDGKKSGQWSYFLNNGQMQSTGRYHDGKIAGEWVWYYKTGDPRGTGGFDDNEQKHGKWTRYHPNGQLWDEGEFRHGKKTGTWTVYDESGALVKTQTFK